jgi:hypothetical protein
MSTQLAPKPQANPAELLADRARRNLAARAESADELRRLGLALGLYEEVDDAGHDEHDEHDERTRLATASPFLDSGSDAEKEACPDPGRHIRRLYVA